MALPFEDPTSFLVAADAIQSGFDSLRDSPLHPATKAHFLQPALRHFALRIDFGAVKRRAPLCNRLEPAMHNGAGNAGVGTYPVELNFFVCIIPTQRRQ